MKFRCTNCKNIEEYSFQYFNENGKCLECDGKLELVGPIYVNVYLIDKAYGGPEEGGWFYLCGEPEESIKCEDINKAFKIKEEKEKEYMEENKNRRPIDSVLSDGQYAIYIEDHFACSFPSQRPYYE